MKLTKLMLLSLFLLTSSRAMATFCQNDPVNGVDPTGLDVRTSPEVAEGLQALFGYGNINVASAGNGMVDVSIADQATRLNAMRSATYGASSGDTLYFGALASAMQSENLYTLNTGTRTLSLDPSYVPFAGNPGPGPLRCPDAENPERLLVPLALTGLMTGGTVYLQMGPEAIGASLISRFGPAIAGGSDLARRGWNAAQNAYYRLGASLSRLTGENTSLGANRSSRILSWGRNATGHLVKHRDALGYGHVSPQQAQKMLPQLRAAANQLLNSADPVLTRVGSWNTIPDCRFYIANGKMLVTRASGEFLTVIEKTSNRWYELASSVQ